MSEKPAPLLEIEGLSVEYRGAGRKMKRVLETVGLAIGRGETLGLVGESGSGKSTLARTLLRFEPAAAGRIEFDGEDWRSLSGSRLRRRRWKMQIVFQDPVASLDPRVRAGDAVAEPIRIKEGLSRRAALGRARELLRLVGLGAGSADRHPHELSGGERQRVAIARALAPEPLLVVCDEPISALDTSVGAQIENLLLDLQERTGVAYLFISHDVPAVGRMADRVAVLYAGRVVEEGPAGSVLGRPQHPYTQALVGGSALPGDPPEDAFWPRGCPFHPRCAIARERCRSEAPELRGSGGARAACFFPGEMAYSPKL